MSKIESSLGKVAFNRKQGPRVLTVEDSTDNYQNYEQNDYEQSNQQQFKEDPMERLRDLETLRVESKELRKQAPVPAKNRLDILLGIARSARDVEVDGIIFSLRSLKAKEIQEITEKLIEIGSSVDAITRLEMRKQIIGRSLYAIDGQNIDAVLGTNDIDDKVEFVSQLDESLLQHLSNMYAEMKNDNDKRFSDLGKTQEEIEENIKK